MIFELRMFGLPVLQFSAVRAELVDEGDPVVLGTGTEVPQGNEDTPYGFARGSE